MVYAYALFCLVASPLDCVPHDLGQKEREACMPAITAYATTWTQSNAAYRLRRGFCTNVPLPVDGIQAMSGMSKKK